VLVFEIRFPHLFDAPLVVQKRKMEIHSVKTPVRQPIISRADQIAYDTLIRDLRIDEDQRSVSWISKRA
jgi:hypothetical protein